MSKKRRASNKGFTLLEAVACLALIGAVAVPIGSALAVISQGPRERQTHTAIATGLESALERICAMDFDDVPMSDGNKPVDLGITAYVNGQRKRVTVYVKPWGFLRNVEWQQNPVSLDVGDSLTPKDPWELKAKSKGGLLYDPNVKLVKVKLDTMTMSTLLLREQVQWQAGGPSVGEGVAPEPDSKDVQNRREWRRYRGCMMSQRSKGRQPWLRWIKSKRRRH